MDSLELYDITDDYAAILWARLDEHTGRDDGSCAAGCVGLCWDRASARGTLMLAGRYSAGLAAKAAESAASRAPSRG